MNYKKCMKNNTCKTCSDYLWCKDDKEEGDNNGKRRQFKKNKLGRSTINGKKGWKSKC